MKFGLKRPLGRNYSVSLEDVAQTKMALQHLGYYPKSKDVDPWPDEDLFSAIKSYQKRNGLNPDGFMKPGGETELALADEEIPSKAANRCGACGAWHGGVFSPNVCADCWGKGIR